MFRFLLPVLTALFVLRAQSLTPAPPPLEPVNWEADADPRFEPRVEQVVVDRNLNRAKQDDATDTALWDGWGLAAMEPLRKILDDPRWEDAFKRTALHLLYACPLDGADAALAEELKRRADAASDGNRESMSTCQSHIAQAASRSLELLQPLLNHDNPDVRYHAASAIIMHRRQIPEEVQRVIDAFADSADPALRGRALGLLGALPDRENNERELEIAASISKEAVTSTRRSQENQAAQERAAEPMKLILERERNR